MIHEGDRVGLRRESEITDPAGTLVENLADRVFETALAFDVMNNRQFASRVPIGPANVRENFARRSPGDRTARQHAIDGFELAGVGAVQNEREFVSARDAEQSSVGNLQRLRDERVRHSRKDLCRLSVPSGGVNYGFVRGEAARVDRASFGGQATIGWL